MRKLLIVLSATVLSTMAASAADYRDAPYRRGGHIERYAYAPQYTPGIRPARPLYLVEAPPRYVQDLRIGAPGQWVVRQPDLVERLFGMRSDLYAY